MRKVWYGSAEKFERIWNAAESVDAVCIKYKLGPWRHETQKVVKVAYALRKRGYKLKKFRELSAYCWKTRKVRPKEAADGGAG